MKGKKLIAMFTAVMLVMIAVVGCATATPSANPAASVAASTAATTTTVQPADSTKPTEPAIGGDNNKGRPYNLTPTKYDSRDMKYLTSINGTKLPISDKTVTLTVWRGFSSTIMKGLDESEVFKEMEKRTNVHIEFIYPTVGQEPDNFNLRISSNDLPDIFSTPPEYKGGYQKAVADGVYLELTPYYDKGLMPNVKFLRESRADINRDFIDDSGKMNFFPMVDIIGSAPWSGMWVRQDWVDGLGLKLPKTISDWDTMLRAMKTAKKVAPLAMNITQWYGVATNYMFAGSYDTGYEWINKEGTALYGPIQPGYLSFLTQMNKWYKDGLLDPDFATRDYESYNANIATSKIGGFGLSYGELGQIIKTGVAQDPNFKLTPVLQPTSYDGQVIHLHQNNATVRSDHEYLTVKAKTDGLDEIAVKYKDYWYSQDGGDLCSYGPEGVSYKWNADGTYSWIYPALTNTKGLDFWTLYPMFKLHNWAYLRNSSAHINAPEVDQCIALWATQDNSWLVPDNISPMPEESTELASIMTDINTYRDEMTLKFINGQEPLTNFDKFVTKVKSMNVDRAAALKTASITRYNARK